ncbi:Error-prone, lesion bypass DNA polymerase V (UmuC) [Photobacterium marinum]|uniref:Error-prone, lesion bypass DNA polymerase V (UmuC) n=1 Tax=Photobacterium marinum TaxID=1056511 RepID=L8J6F2_9GAMM|nr:DUF4113 domain-containing protein [Photobacterium marinum]ELR64435.1 Error-prone, lesion bypass DNA polymerase V (UmuC) [Photobacterium marinum]
MAGLIAILDGTRFYASASGILHPEYREKPVVVTSGNQGIIIAANRLATDKCGLKKFKPVFEYKDKIDTLGVQVLEANFNLFGYHSEQFQSIIKSHFPESSSYSVDEVFCQMPCHINALHYLQKVRRNVYKLTRTPIGAAASHNCTLAKVAAWASKKQPGYKGLCVLESLPEIDRILSTIPVGDLWGVGRRIDARLKHMGINKAIELKHADVKKMKKEFGRPITSLIAELHGQRIFNWRKPDELHIKDMISSTRSIKERLHSVEELRQALAYHVHEVCAKARNQQSKIKTIQFFCRTSPYDNQKYSGGTCVKLDYPSSDTAMFLKLLSEAIPRLIPQKGTWIPLYKIGVTALEVTDSRHDQGDLFAPIEDTRKMSALDSINALFGKNTLFLGAKGTGTTGERMESGQLKNPHSRWSDVPTVFC